MLHLLKRIGCILLLSQILLSTTLLAEPKLKLAVSLPILKTILFEVGKEKVEIITVLPGISDPHIFELKAAQLRDVMGSDLMFVVGAGMEPWLKGFISDLSHPPVVFSKELRLGDTWTHAVNPHIWTDPITVQKVAMIVKSKLCERDPLNCAFYEKNGASFSEELVALNRDLVKRIESWRNRRFISVHPAWFYFANRYGLIESYGLKKSHGDQVTSGDILRIRELRSEGVEVVFIDVSESYEQIEGLVEDLKLKVARLDVHGAAAGNYREFILENVREMERVMQ